jgi:hypothetical protein
MDFLKNHYEKIILAVVLIGLTVVVVLLPSRLDGSMPSTDSAISNAVPQLDVSTNVNALKELEELPPVVLSGTNNLFNPVLWRKLSNGQMFKSLSDKDFGPGAVVFVKPPAPLYLILSFESVSSTNQYVFGVTQEANKDSNKRTKKPVYASLNESTEFFKLVGVVGDREAPTELVIELKDTKERVSITKEKPYKRVAGYKSDLQYAPRDKADTKTFIERRVGDALLFESDTNHIVDIRSNEVVLSAVSTGKRTTIKLNTAP